jgi:DNA modification methylase
MSHTDRASRNIEFVPIDQITPSARNARLHPPGQIEKLVESIQRFGFTAPILLDEHGEIIAGHGRLLAARQLGLREVPCVRLSHLTPEQVRAYRILDNRLADLSGGWDLPTLRTELAELRVEAPDLTALGYSDRELAHVLQMPESALAGPARPQPPKLGADEGFTIQPFSVLDTTTETWRARREHWESIGFNPLAGLPVNATYSASSMPIRVYEAKDRFNVRMGRRVRWDEFFSMYPEQKQMTRTSGFDPVLCECVYRWWCPPCGTVLDPFSGGPTRGIMAAALGRRYVGVDVRSKQIEANRCEWERLASDWRAARPAPEWRHGDSRHLATICADVDADCIFSSPPYPGVEQYSDQDDDLSTLDYEAFREGYRLCIAQACARLRDDRFAVFVVGEGRDRKGRLTRFICDTIDAFTAAGLEYYQDAVLVNVIASLTARAPLIFNASRRLGRRHQWVLVFLKGDYKRATRAQSAAHADQDSIV